MVKELIIACLWLHTENEWCFLESFPHVKKSFNILNYTTDDTFFDWCQYESAFQFILIP